MHLLKPEHYNTVRSWIQQRTSPTWKTLAIPHCIFFPLFLAPIWPNSQMLPFRWCKRGNNTQRWWSSLSTERWWSSSRATLLTRRRLLCACSRNTPRTWFARTWSATTRLRIRWRSPYAHLLQLRRWFKGLEDDGSYLGWLKKEAGWRTWLGHRQHCLFPAQEEAPFPLRVELSLILGHPNQSSSLIHPPNDAMWRAGGRLVYVQIGSYGSNKRRWHGYSKKRDSLHGLYVGIANVT